MIWQHPQTVPEKVRIKKFLKRGKSVTSGMFISTRMVIMQVYKNQIYFYLEKRWLQIYSLLDLTFSFSDLILKYFILVFFFFSSLYLFIGFFIPLKYVCNLMDFNLISVMSLEAFRG